MIVSPVIIIGTPRSGTSVTAKWLIENYGVVMTVDGYYADNEKLHGIKDTYEDGVVVNCNSLLNQGIISHKIYRKRMKRFFKRLREKANNKPWGFKDPRLTNGLPWIVKYFNGNLTIIRTKRRAELVMRSMIEKINFTPQKAADTINGYEKFYRKVLNGLPIIEVNFDGIEKVPEDFVNSFDQSLTNLERLR
jgi:hypothetical protein